MGAKNAKVSQIDICHKNVHERGPKSEAMNFYNIIVQNGKNNSIEIAPDFQIDDHESDLMIRGKSFYAVWDEEKGMWSQNEYDVRRIVDAAMMKKKAEIQNVRGDAVIHVKRMISSSSGSWLQYCNYIKHQPDRYVQLDDKLTFADTEVKKEDYVSKRLSYSLKPGSHDSYDEIMSTLYSEENRQKIEWAIGSILSGDSRKIQKFVVLYGKGGTGKGTVLKIIGKLFKGYDAAFVAKNLANSNKDFSMEPFKNNPLVAIDEDGDLNKIEDSTKINSIVSHERMLMNEKNKPQYPYIPHCFLFIGTNEPVKIKDAESGIIRRLIDVEPTGTRLPARKYNTLMDRVDFELGGIADHCLKVYKKLGRHYYDNYKPKSMMYRTDVFVNYIDYWYDTFVDEDGVNLTTAYARWNEFCEKSGIDPKSRPRHVFREELKNYFRSFEDIARIDGKQVRSWYSQFIVGCLDQDGHDIPPDEPEEASGIKLESIKSSLDELLKDCKAQYAKEDGTPEKAWAYVTTTLKDLDTTRLHYILGPEWLFRVDFDLKNAEGKKDAKLNREAADKWPPTYAEYSKSGAGIHLYYRYTGDIESLKGLYAPEIELKINRGKSGIRRQFSKCNDIPIAVLSSGLPVKEQNKMVDPEVIKNERHLINLIAKALRKEVNGCESTKMACWYIDKVLTEAYESGMHYDVTNLRSKVRAFALHSTNNKTYCTDLVRKMHWCSDDCAPNAKLGTSAEIVIYDVEVAPNKNLVGWKFLGKDQPVVQWTNPKPEDIAGLLEYGLVGFNCRRYDNHILHAMLLGYKPQAVYEISKGIVEGSDKCFFSEAWDYSLVDIYDMSSEKMSLKKFEIQMQLELDSKIELAQKMIRKGIHVSEAAENLNMNAEELKGYLDGKTELVQHREMNVDWTQPVPDELWPEMLEYNKNDVISTEELFLTKKRQADWTARQILADIAGMNTNSTTNSLTTRIIFGDNKDPQSSFNYRFMGDEQGSKSISEFTGETGIRYKLAFPEYAKFNAKGRPVFPGYTYDRDIDPETGKKTGPYVSRYRGEEVGEGGYVYAEQGVYSNVALLDISSMHPSSVREEELFGPEYTPRFVDILDTRILIKHKQYEDAKKLFGGKLSKYLDDPKQAKALAQALKIAINSVYGLTSAKFDNPFRDTRNVDNIVAKRGALFMVNLKHEVQARGFTVAHIKTDSIKIPNATPDIIRFVMDYGKLYGYNFEHEATYERMCLVNNAVYIAKFDKKEDAMAKYGYIPSDLYEESGRWTATGTQFQVPYVFKKLFSGEDILLADMAETKSVTTKLFLDLNENLSDGDHNYIFVGKTGAFCPIQKGHNGGELCREKGGKYYAATGSKGYRWKEYEIVRDMGLRDEIDISYYETLCDKAREEIGKYGPFDIFVDPSPLPPWDLNKTKTGS